MTRAWKSPSATWFTVVSRGTGPWPFLPRTGWSSSPATVTWTSSWASRYSGYSSSESSKSSAARSRTLRCASTMKPTIPARSAVTRAQAGLPDPVRPSVVAVTMTTERVAFPPGRLVPGGDGEDVPDVPAGVVVREDGPPEPGRRAARGAVGAQHPRGGENGGRRVLRGEAAGRVNLDGVLGEGGRLELHRPLGALAVLAVVDAARRGPAVVRLHRPDPGEHLPSQPGAGPGRAPVPGQVPGRNGGRAGPARPGGRAGPEPTPPPHPAHRP